MIPITVHVPDHRVPEFYVRFGEFVADVPDPEAPTRLESGVVPTWTQADDALELAARLWEEVSGPGEFLLHIMTVNVKNETRHFTPAELAEAFGHPGGQSRVAGVLGGIGKAIRRADIPIYKSPSGGSWHYVWDWDRERYSMTPEVAKILRQAKNRRRTPSPA